MITSKTDTPPAGRAFDEFLDQQLQDTAFRTVFDRKLARVKSVATLINLLDEIREESGVTKAELARRMNRKPSAVSRLLSGAGANPTIDTLVDLADALGLELDVKIRRQPDRPGQTYSPLQVNTSI